jgi:chromosome segregation ATPase
MSQVPLPLTRIAAAVLLAGFVAPCAWAQAAGIFTCVDSKGRRLTSDRPIPECADREQKELNSSGTVRRTHGPTLTAAEQAVADEKKRKLAEEQQRQAEEKRRERALLARYPTQAAHDQERTKALNAAQEVIASGQKRTVELQQQRKQLDVELEFYNKDPSKAPPKLKRQIEEVDQHIAAQRRFQENQEEEKRRINARFDEELAKLRVLWAQLKNLQTAPAPAAAASSVPARPQAAR